MIRTAMFAFVLAMSGAAAPACAQADAYVAPRTSEDRADISGLWAAVFVTPMQRPSFATSLSVAPEDARAIVNRLQADTPPVIDPDITHHAIDTLATVRGDMRSSLIVEPADGRIPFSAAGGRVAGQSFQQFNFAYDNPEERSLQERCLGGFGAPPMRVLPSIIPMRIVLTKTHAVINLEDVAGLRIVNMLATPPPSAVRTIEGWSAGRWEGDTLVIETSHFRDDLPVREQYGPPVVIGAGTRIVEKFTRVSENELLYEFSVTDPKFYTQPWRGEFTMTRFTQPDYEYACHEANYSMRNVLLGGRALAARKAGK